MKLAVVQMKVREHNKEANVKRAMELFREAAANADVVMLPEIWTTGYSLGHLRKEADYIDGPVVEEVREIARQNACSIVAGSIPLRAEDEKVYNTTLVIDAGGEIIFRYSKVHLFGLFKEERFFAPGNNFDTYELNGVTCGSAICYDLRFPELFRHLALQGAKIIFLPAAWPEARGEVWDLLNRARAVENHNYMVAVNCVGSFQGERFYGHSMVVDPMGKKLIECGMEEEIAYCDIDLDYVDKVRKRINALNDVRPELIK